MTANKPNDVRVSMAQVFKAVEYADDHPDRYLSGTTNWCAAVAFALNRQIIDAQPADRQGEPPRATEKDIERWHALIAESPEGPWVMGNGGSFDRQGVKPISDELMSELGQWLRMGYTPWNGRSVSPTDRQFMYLLYYSVQGLVSRVRRAERDLHHAQPADQRGASLSIPEECPHMIVFDDADREALMFAGCGSRQAALKTFEQISGSWNAHLFVRVARNSRDDKHPCASFAADQQGDPVGQWSDDDGISWCDGNESSLASARASGWLTRTLYRQAQPVTAKVVLRAEARECRECNHVGINDESSGSACHSCDWSGGHQAEDK